MSKNNRTWAISHKRNWQQMSDAKTVDVVANSLDKALDRFWVWMWKNSRYKRNDTAIDIVSVVRGPTVVV